MIFNRMKF